MGTKKTTTPEPYRPRAIEPSGVPLPSRGADARPEDRPAMDRLIAALKGTKK